MYRRPLVFLDSIENKWKCTSVNAKCDECFSLYKAKISTALRQEKIVGHHQCRRCSSRRAGKKTASKMSKIYSELYKGENNPAKKPGVGDKISKSKKGVSLTEEHKKSLKKPKTKTEKFKIAMQDSKLRELRSKRMKENNPVKDLNVRNKISESVSNYLEKNKKNFYKKFKTGWISNSKTKKPIWCRSGLEIRFLNFINDIKFISSVESAENIRIKYLYEGVEHNYLPDFRLTFKNKNTIIVEIKGSYFETLSNWNLKLEALKEFCKNTGISYSILTEKDELKWEDMLLKKMQM
jgi:hypothetical protein